MHERLNSLVDDEKSKNYKSFEDFKEIMTHEYK
jgi:hypothetical protein